MKFHISFNSLWPLYWEVHKIITKLEHWNFQTYRDNKHLQYTTKKLRITNKNAPTRIWSNTLEVRLAFSDSTTLVVDACGG